MKEEILAVDERVKPKITCNDNEYTKVRHFHGKEYEGSDGKYTFTKPKITCNDNEYTKVRHFHGKEYEGSDGKYTFTKPKIGLNAYGKVALQANFSIDTTDIQLDDTVIKKEAE